MPDDMDVTQPVYREWVTVDEAAYLLEQNGMRDIGERVLNGALQSGQVAVRAKARDGVIYRELPSDDREEYMRGATTERAMQGLQLDWTSLREFMSHQDHIPGVANLPVRLPSRVSLAAVIPPAGPSPRGRVPGLAMWQPQVGFWASERESTGDQTGAGIEPTPGVSHQTGPNAEGSVAGSLPGVLTGTAQTTDNPQGYPPVSGDVGAAQLIPDQGEGGDTGETQEQPQPGETQEQPQPGEEEQVGADKPAGGRRR